jgi:glutamine amidotransferase
MARLFGLIGNRADLGGRVLAVESASLRVDTTKLPGGPRPLGWGLGFYQGGEVLMRRRPIDERGVVDVAHIAGDVRGDIVLGHVRSATVGGFSTENTHPFRYRQWLFAQAGTIAHFDSIRDRLVASVPEFLRAGIRGETDAEVLFHIYLSFLHDAGRLQEGMVDAAAVGEALRSSLAVADAMAAEVGGEPAAINLVVSNGEFVVALHRGDAMAYREFRGRDDADAILGDDLVLRQRTPDLARMHFTLLASNFDETPSSRWKPVKGPALVTLTRADSPVVEAL